MDVDQNAALTRAVLALLVADTAKALVHWGVSQKESGVNALPVSDEVWTPAPVVRDPLAAAPSTAHLTINNESALLNSSVEQIKVDLPTNALNSVQKSSDVQRSSATPVVRNSASESDDRRGTAGLLSALSSARAMMSHEEKVADPAQAMKRVEADVGICRLCQLGASRQGVLMGYGPLDAKIVFVGAGGNPQEFEEHRIMSIKGKPEATELFDKMVSAMKSILPEDAKESIYFTNVIKCAAIPPRNLQRKVAVTCLRYLREEIRLIQPKIIVVWGQTAYTAMFGDETSIISARGQIRRFEQIPAIATHHPMECLKNQNLKKLVWNDLRLAVHVVKGEPTS